MLKKAFLILFLVLSFSTLSFAQDISDEDDDSFDPFADYSEFIEASTEESDLNFFKFGRLLSAGAWGGFRTFTGNKGKNNSAGNFFGLFFTYYFSLQFAAQVSFTTGSHSVSIPITNGEPAAQGDIRYQNVSLHAKYFINTQNLTKNIAQFNPYIVSGFSLVTRSGSLTNTNGGNTTSQGADSASGFDIGVGIEYLFNNKKAFAGFQLLYQSANFPGDNVPILSGPASSDPAVRNDSGDPIMGMASVGFNF